METPGNRRKNLVETPGNRRKNLVETLFSSGYKAHASLDEFTRRYKNRIERDIVLYTKDLYADRDLIYLPVYMTSLL